MTIDDTFPVLAGDDQPLSQCLVCKKACGEPGDFLSANVGAILHTDDKRETGGPDDLMSVYFALVKHGAEPHGPYVTVDLVRDLIGGQADLLFCSAACLRSFFSSAIDELERRWIEA